ncbi:hypothetical protein ACRRTK_014881 [Alexandromys fortis]
MKNVFLHFLEKHLYFDTSPLSTCCERAGILVFCGIHCRCTHRRTHREALPRSQARSSPFSAQAKPRCSRWPPGGAACSSVHFFCLTTRRALAAAASHEADARRKRTNIYLSKDNVLEVVINAKRQKKET